MQRGGVSYIIGVLKAEAVAHKLFHHRGFEGFVRGPGRDASGECREVEWEKLGKIKTLAQRDAVARHRSSSVRFLDSSSHCCKSLKNRRRAATECSSSSCWLSWRLDSFIHPHYNSGSLGLSVIRVSPKLRKVLAVPPPRRWHRFP